MEFTNLNGLVGLSNRYGKDPRYVLAGGGNSSWKDENIMYVKSSGTSLAAITAEGFAGMDRAKLRALMEKRYDTENERSRDAEVISDMTDARLPGSGNLRPSVETLLHNLFPYKYVLHLHPALVNGMTCAVRGKETAAEIFGVGAVWVREYKPGYELAKLCKKIIAEYTRENGKAPKIMFLQNHGVFAAADNIAEIDGLYERVMGGLDAWAALKPADATRAGRTDTACAVDTAVTADVMRTCPADHPRAADAAETAVRRISGLLSAPPYAATVVYHANNPDIAGYLENSSNFRGLNGGAFTPDHIVYCKARFLYIEDFAAERLSEQIADFTTIYGYAPRVVCVRGAGAFICANTAREADNALALFEDAVKIAVYSRNFGGPRYLSAEMTDFIENWELEHYRQKVAQ
jgi:rhamnose utilization protein RhaD (predicted bifunctional aldolase and dehydrogenase)